MKASVLWWGSSQKQIEFQVSDCRPIRQGLSVDWITTDAKITILALLFPHLPQQLKFWTRLNVVGADCKHDSVEKVSSDEDFDKDDETVTRVVLDQ